MQFKRLKRIKKRFIQKVFFQIQKFVKEKERKFFVAKKDLYGAK